MIVCIRLLRPYRGLRGGATQRRQSRNRLLQILRIWINLVSILVVSLRAGAKLLQR